MSYRNRFSTTTIRPSQRDRLSINVDYDRDPSNIFPVFLYTPDMRDTNDHYHIVLNKKQAAILKSWLESFLKDPRVRSKKSTAKRINPLRKSWHADDCWQVLAFFWKWE